MNPAILAFAVAVLLLGALFVCMDVGFRVGRARRARNPDLAGEGAGTVDAAVFGLLGLALAFTFSGASDRLAIRRAQIVQEANAIGTAYLRLDVLPDEAQPPLRDAFRRYVDARIGVYQKLPDFTAAKAQVDIATKLQREIWSRSIAIANACRTFASSNGGCVTLKPI